MQQRLMKKTAVYSFVFFLVSMGVVLAISAGRAREAKALRERQEMERQKEAGDAASFARGGELSFVQGQADGVYLRIPLPDECRAQDILIENFYMDRQLRIFVPDADEAFYGQNRLSGNRGEVLGGNCGAAEGGVVLNLSLKGIYECRTILEDGNLYIRFFAPSEVYDKIVVIDPDCGGDDAGNEADGMAEKDINLQIAHKLAERLDHSGIKAYYTRMDDLNPLPQERAALGNEIRADMYICIQVGAKEDSSVYGVEAVYDGEHFNPGFGNKELASLLEEEVARAVNGRSIGVAQAGEMELEKAFCGVMIPAAAIRPGCITNPQEALVLGREEQTDKIAEGIYQAILEAYETNTFR